MEIEKKILFIAEIGINHNGDMSIIKKLIDNACEAKFHCVKFQKRDVNKVYSKEILDSPRESPWGKTTREQKIGLELTKEHYDEINDYCSNKNMINKNMIQFFQILSKKFNVEISKKYSLKDAAQAHKDLEARLLTGPAVIIP